MPGFEEDDGSIHCQFNSFCIVKDLQALHVGVVFIHLGNLRHDYREKI